MKDFANVRTYDNEVEITWGNPKIIVPAVIFCVSVFTWFVISGVA